MIRACLLGAALLLGCSEQTVELFDGSSRGDGSSGELSSRDPERCGEEARHCEDDEYCVAGECVCRPPLTRIDERCVDTQADANNCGSPGTTCSLCVDGVCGPACGAGRVDCDGGCVDTGAHPLHCGECRRPCGANQICVEGLCREFSPAACTSCPCRCASACCTYPGHASDVICVAGIDSC